MLQLGHAKVSDFISAYGISKQTTKGQAKRGDSTATGTNGTTVPAIENDDLISSVESLKSVMADMLKDRFLVQVQEHHMHPRTDTINTMRARMTAQLRKNFTVETRLAKEVDRQIQIKLAEMDDGDTGDHTGMKRKAVPTLKGRLKKRQKVSIYDDEKEEEEWEIDVSLVQSKTVHELIANLICRRRKRLWSG